MKNKIVFLLFILVYSGLNAKAQQQTINNNSSNIIPFTGFKFQDIGQPTKAGNITIKNNIFEITAAGSDIWGVKDEFYFCYKPVKGDFDISTQVLSLTTTNMYTKAGIMARVDLDDNSQHIFYQVFPNNSARNKNNGGCEFQYRLEKAGQMEAIYPDPATAGNQYDVAFPNIWIRLKRIGDVFESYMSSDNKNWKLYTTFTMKLPTELLVGLAVTSHDKNAFTTARFASVQLKKY